jgi:hypothetical protein
MSIFKSKQNYLLALFMVLISILPLSKCGLTRDSAINALTVSATSQSAISNANMLVTSTGNIFVTYESNTDIYLGVYDSDFKTIKAPYVATADATNTQKGAALAETPDSVVMMVWSSDHVLSGLYNVFSNVYQLDGTIISPASDGKISSYTDAISTEQSISKAGSNMVIAYCHTAGGTTGSTYFDIQGYISKSDGTTVSITINSTPSPLIDTTGITVAALTSGFVAAYVKYVNPDRLIYIKIFDALGNTLVDEIKVNTAPGNNGQPAVTGLKNGKFVVTWTNSDTNTIYVRTYKEDGTSINSFENSVYTGNSCSNSKVASLSFGGYAISYQYNTGSFYNVFFQIYDATDAVKASETVINSESPQTHFHIATVIGTSANDNIYFAYETLAAITADKFKYTNGITCTDFPINVKQGNFNVDFTGKISDGVNTTFGVQLSSFPNTGNILAPTTELQAAMNTDYPYLIFSINTSATTTFEYKGSLNGVQSAASCKVTVTSCAIGCQTCSAIEAAPASNCLTCITNYYKKNEVDPNNTCYSVDAPPSGYVLQNGGFDRCFDSCAKCTEVGSSAGHKCTECNANYYPLEDKLTECYLSSSPVTGYTFSVDKFYLNRVCYTSCSVCLETGTSTDHKCHHCATGYYPLVDKTSMCYQNDNSVPVGYFFSNGIFLLCYNTCASCTATGDSQNHNCNTCRTNYYVKEDMLTNCYLNTDIPKGYYLDLIAKLFKKCYSTCTQCTQVGDANDNRCTTCAYGYSKIIDKPTNCVPSNVPIPGYFLDSNNNTFTKCYNTCKTCNIAGDDHNNQCTACKDKFYPSEDNSANCYDSQKPVEGYYLDSSVNIFKHCYENCFSCSAHGDENAHNCVKCIIDYYNLEDNNSQCFPEDEQIEGYKFKDNIFKKCANSCEEISTDASQELTSEDANALSNVVNDILSKPMSNDVIVSVAQNLQIPKDLNVNLLENLNNLVDKYANFIENSNANVSPEIFDVFDKVMDYTNQFVEDGTSDNGAGAEAAVAQYTKTQEVLQKIGDIYIAKNLDNLDLLVSNKNFEMDIFDYNKYDTEQKIDWSTKRTSVVNLNGCANKLQQSSENDKVPMSKLDLKTNNLKLNPYISNAKQNVTGLITSRQIKINAYDPKNGKKLDIADLCKDIPMDLDIQANEFKQYNATDYNTYKRIGIDIFDKSRFKECQSFSNNESYADFTTQFVNNLTDVAIDCGANCTYNDISNSKAVKCNCDNIFDSNINIFKQTLSFSVQATKLDIIRCVGTAFKDGETISANPSFWFIIALFIFLSTVIALSFKFHDFNRVIKKVMFFQINFKAPELMQIQQMRQTNLNIQKQPIEIDHNPQDGDEKKDNLEKVEMGEVQSDKQIDVYIKKEDEKPYERVTDNKNVEKQEDVKETNTDSDHYKGTFLKVDINQGTADYCTADELVKFDRRSFKKYWRDIFFVRHEIGKIFFFPNIYVPKFLVILFFAQVTSVKFALNAILYNDALINERNSLKDNVRKIFNFSFRFII